MKQKKRTETNVLMNWKENVIGSLGEDVHVPQSQEIRRASGPNVMKRANGRS